MLIAVVSGFVLAALAPFLKRRLGHRVGWLIAALPAALFLYFVGFLRPVSDGLTLSYALAWVPGLGVNLSFYVDGLSLLFALLISGIGALIMVYAGGYLEGHPHQGRFFSFMLMFMASMLGLVLADNVITLFVFWELTSITSFLLIGFDHGRQAARRAAVQALVVTGAGGLALLAGLILMGLIGGSFELSQLLSAGATLRGDSAYPVIVVLVLAGAFTKSAQVPFHSWLPNAMEAPTPVSAYLHSATMVKAGVYLVMRMTPALGDTQLWSVLLVVFGAATLLAGALLALRETDLKLMLANSTVASLGLMVMLTGIGSEEAVLGAVLYLFAHSLFKGALFMVAGTVDHETGTRDITGLGGLRRLMPLTAVAATVAALSMAGIPPFAGFVAKEEMYHAMAHGDVANIAVLAASVAGNALMLAIAAAVAVVPFFGERPETPKPPQEGSVMLLLGPVTLSALGLLVAFAVAELGHFVAAPTASAILGVPAIADLELWGGFSTALALSVLTIALGVGVFAALASARAGMGGLLETIGWGPDRGFDQLVNALTRLAAALTGLIQPGVMKRYMFVIFAVTAAAIFGPMAVFDLWPRAVAMPGLHAHEWAVLAMAVVGVGVVLAAATRLIAIVSLGIQGFAVALIYLLFGAPDLSFTQFMVETLSVVILALVLTRLHLDPSDARTPAQRMTDGALSVAVGAGFGLVMLKVVEGAFDARLTEFFIANSVPIAHGHNIVNVILVDYRALDTLGEITVVMIAGLAILGLIRLRPSGAAAGGGKTGTP